MSSHELPSVPSQLSVRDAPLTGLIRMLHDTLDIDVSAYDETFLRKSLATHMRASGIDCIAAYGEYLIGHRAAAMALQASLQISHSEFFRDPLTYAMLEQRILPHLLATKAATGHSEIRIWSAACAAGQEAWSVAILLDGLTKAGAPAPAYRIFASDIAESELTHARAGVYSAKAVGNVRLRHLSECFIQQGEAYAIGSRLRSRVDFSTYDLLDAESSSPEASIYGDFDLILCCNLLIYYRPAIQQQILNKLCRDLIPGGYLITGEAERDTVAKHPWLRPVAATTGIFQKT